MKEIIYRVKWIQDGEEFTKDYVNIYKLQSFVTNTNNIIGREVLEIIKIENGEKIYLSKNSVDFLETMESVTFYLKETLKLVSNPNNFFKYADFIIGEIWDLRDKLEFVWDDMKQILEKIKEEDNEIEKYEKEE